MAFYLERQGTTSTPYVLIYEETNYMRISGRSFHEGIIDFFKEINDWLENYLDGNFGEFTFDCDMTYFNSSTSKILLNMLLKMDECSVGDNKVTVNWITTDDNEIITECGEDFRDELENLSFNMIIEESS